MNDGIAIGTMIGTVIETVTEKGKERGTETGIMTGITADIMTEIAIIADGQPALLHSLEKPGLHVTNHPIPARATMSSTSTRRKTP